MVEYLEGVGVLADPASYHVAPLVPDLEWTSSAVIGRAFEQVTSTARTLPPHRCPVRPATRSRPTTRSPTRGRAARSPRPRGSCASMAPGWVIRSSTLSCSAPTLSTARASTWPSRCCRITGHAASHASRARFPASMSSRTCTARPRRSPTSVPSSRYIAGPREPAALYGLSLGGYVAAAVAALEPSLRAVVVGVPVVNLARIMRTHTPQQSSQDPHYIEMFGRSADLEVVTSPIRLWDVRLPRSGGSTRTR